MFNKSLFILITSRTKERFEVVRKLPDPIKRRISPRDFPDFLKKPGLRVNSIYTQAEDLEGLKEAVRDAVRCHFEEEERHEDHKIKADDKVS